MMRFFWTMLLPMSATGACAAVLLWLTRPLLHRIGRLQWPAGAVAAALCLFVIPVFLLAPEGFAAKVPGPAWPAPAGQSAPGSVPASVPALSFQTGSAASLAKANASSEQAGTGAANTPGAMADGERIGNGTPAAWAAPVCLRVLPLFWAAGMGFVLLLHTASYLLFAARLKQSSRPVTDDAVLAGLRAARQKSGAARVPALRYTAAIASPLAMGLLRPCIYLPDGVLAGDPLDHALHHECVHLHKGHLFWKLAAQLICAVHWFNPAAWLLPRLLNEACEFDCDRAVASALDGRQRQSYCMALLDAAEGGRIPRCVSAFSRPAAILRRRIEAVLAPKPRLSRRVAAVLVCAALVLCASFLTACAAGQAAGSAAGMLPPASPGDSLPKEEPQQGDEGMPDEGPADAAPPAQDGAQAAPAAPEWVWPVPDMTVISRKFSTDLSGEIYTHRGVDICAAQDAPILAVHSGTVTTAGRQEAQWAYGNYVEVDHGDGTRSLYAHCSTLLVQAGDTVTAGQQIACVGSTGASTGLHCHLELSREETLIDPLSVLQPPTVIFVDANDRSESVYFDAAAEIFGDDVSDEARREFEQGARFWQASFRKPVTVLNEQKGEAYVTLSLCEYEGTVYICDVPEYGFTETEQWKRISEIRVYVNNGKDAQTPPEVTILANFLNGDETQPTLITSTFKPTENGAE